VADELTEVRAAAARAATEKTPKARLVDLMAGWFEYAERDTPPSGAALLERVGVLYREAEALDAGADAAAGEAALRDFLLGRVLPVLLGRS
jgi:hypothetical protein